MSGWFDLPFWDKEWDGVGDLLKVEYDTGKVYPSPSKKFKVFDLSLRKTKVCILGQDPYHTPGLATGRAFEVPAIIQPDKFPPSLKNIFKEYVNDTGFPPPSTGDLSRWVNQGVLLLNTCLTVRRGQPRSHAHVGWDVLIKQCLKALSDRGECVFVMWGRDAQAFLPCVHEDVERKVFVIQSSHPSPFSARLGFFGSRPFTSINAYLPENKQINWRLP